MSKTIVDPQKYTFYNNKNLYNQIKNKIYEK